MDKRMMDKPTKNPLITKEEAIAHCLNRFAENNTDRLHLEAAFALVYASGYRDGMNFAEDCYGVKHETI